MMANNVPGSDGMAAGVQSGAPHGACSCSGSGAESVSHWFSRSAAGASIKPLSEARDSLIGYVEGGECGGYCLFIFMEFHLLLYRANTSQGQLLNPPMRCASRAGLRAHF